MQLKKPKKNEIKKLLTLFADTIFKVRNVLMDPLARRKQTIFIIWPSGAETWFAQVLH